MDLSKKINEIGQAASIVSQDIEDLSEIASAEQIISAILEDITEHFKAPANGYVFILKQLCMDSTFNHCLNDKIPKKISDVLRSEANRNLKASRFSIFIEELFKSGVIDVNIVKEVVKELVGSGEEQEEAAADFLNSLMMGISVILKAKHLNDYDLMIKLLERKNGRLWDQVKKDLDKNFGDGSLNKIAVPHTSDN